MIAGTLLVIGSITGVEERVLALEARGFSVKGRKTHAFEIERSPHDRLATAIAIIITAGILAVRVAAWQ